MQALIRVGLIMFTIGWALWYSQPALESTYISLVICPHGRVSLKDSGCFQPSNKTFKYSLWCMGERVNNGSWSSCPYFLNSILLICLNLYRCVRIMLFVHWIIASFLSFSTIQVTRVLYSLVFNKWTMIHYPSNFKELIVRMHKCMGSDVLLFIWNNKR